MDSVDPLIAACYMKYAFLRFICTSMVLGGCVANSRRWMLQLPKVRNKHYRQKVISNN